MEIGTGSGYQTAVLLELKAEVYSIERQHKLFKKTELFLPKLGYRPKRFIFGDGYKGLPEQAPFDKIIVTAAARKKPPQDLLDQIRVGGRMIIPVGEPGNQMLKLYKKESEEAYAVKDVMPVRFVPLLPDISNETNDMAGALN